VKKTTILAVIAIAGVLNFQVFADDALIGGPADEDHVEINWIGDISVIQVPHDDDIPYKGSVTAYVKNTGTENWGDFHFEIYDPYPLDSDEIDNVHFLDSTMKDKDNQWGVDPTSSQTLSGWTINNTVVGATIDLYFYGDPVTPGELVWFEVYTDNIDSIDWFGVQIHPTPVPEPATIAILGLGGLALVLSRKR